MSGDMPFKHLPPTRVLALHAVAEEQIGAAHGIGLGVGQEIGAHEDIAVNEFAAPPAHDHVAADVATQEIGIGSAEQLVAGEIFFGGKIRSGRERK